MKCIGRLNVSWQRYRNKTIHNFIEHTCSESADRRASVRLDARLCPYDLHSGNWSSGSHYSTMSSHLWPNVLPCTGQLPPCWYWPGILTPYSLTGEAYSSWGDTSVLYAVWCMPWCLVWIFLRTESRFCYPLWSSFGYSVCVFQLRSWLISSPKYLAHDLLPQELGHAEHTGA